MILALVGMVALSASVYSFRSEDRGQSLIASRMGITSIDSFCSTASLYEHSVLKGVIIIDVAPGSPAQKAGLRGSSGIPGEEGFISGDLIVGVDGKEVGSKEDLNQILLRRGAGDRLEVRYIRDESYHTTQLTL